MKWIRRVLFFGAKEWTDKAAIEREMDGYIERYGKDGLIIIEGGAPGADVLSKIVATERSVHVAEVRALWATRHRGAGPQRNHAMLFGLHPEEAVGFHWDIQHESKGSKNMYAKLVAANVPTRIVEG